MLTYEIQALHAIHIRVPGEPGNEASDHVCTSHAPRPMTVVFGLGTRLRVRMRTTYKNGVLRNGQQPSRAENSFIDQGEFVAMKTLSGCKAPRCDMHKFYYKMTVST